MAENQLKEKFSPHNLEHVYSNWQPLITMHTLCL